MPAALEHISLQPQARDVLLRSIESGRLSHAYLFAGPRGAGKLEMAYAFAQALVCERGGCGSCEVCARIEGRRHPDVHAIFPAGASGYLIDQVREVVADAQLAPIQARKKVYIFSAVEHFGTASANAFLKTLEEPSASVTLILLTENEQSVLPTIVSRCQVVRFSSVPDDVAEQAIAQTCACSLSEARAMYAAAGYSRELACELYQASDLREMRQKLLETLQSLPQLDSWQVLKAAQDLCAGGESVVKRLEDRHAEEREVADEFLSRGAMKQLEAAQKREVKAKTRELYGVRCAIVRSWLRDVLRYKAGCVETLANEDARQAIAAVAGGVAEANVLRALAAVDRCEQAIGYNVTPQLCLDSLLYEVGDDLYDPDTTGKI